MGGWVGGWSELELRLSSGQQKLELGRGLSLAIILEVLGNFAHDFYPYILILANIWSLPDFNDLMLVLLTGTVI